MGLCKPGAVLSAARSFAEAEPVALMEQGPRFELKWPEVARAVERCAAALLAQNWLAPQSDLLPVALLAAEPPAAMPEPLKRQAAALPAAER
jgi:hypothetical protein